MKIAKKKPQKRKVAPLPIARNGDGGGSTGDGGGGDLGSATPIRSSEEISKLLCAGNFRRISRLTGFTPQHVGRVLKGSNGATLESAAKIAKAAGVTLDELSEFVAKNRATTKRVDAARKKAALRAARVGAAKVAAASSSAR